MSAWAFLSSSVSSNAFCVLITAIFTCAPAVPTLARASTAISSLFIGEHSQNFILAQDEVLVAIDPYIRARIFAEQNLVTGFNIRYGAISILEEFSTAHCHDFGMVGFLFDTVRQDDT